MTTDVEIQVIEAAPLDSRAEQVMVPMRDGVRLATDVYLPPGPTTHPAVLVRLPYDKCGRYTFMPYLAPHFTDRGYAFVVQDVRGKFRSEGETMPYVHEVADGYDTLEWIVSQPWSNGDVGMFGDSYYGFTQWAAVASGHPSLRAIVPRVTSADLGFGRGWSERVQEIWGADYMAHYWVDQNIYEYPVDWTHRPIAAVWDRALDHIGRRSAGLDSTLTHQHWGPDTTAYPSGHPFDKLTVPVLHSVGWFDNIGPYSMADYIALTGRPDLAPLQYLIADSTDHENYSLEDVPITPELDHDSDDEALARLIPRYLGPALDFFDAFLLRKSAPSNIPRVRWHLAHNGWQASDTWPPPSVREHRLYLGNASAAARGPEGGTLRAEPQSGHQRVSWMHDPANLVPSAVENPFAFLFEYPDETEIEQREDVITFTSEPLKEHLELAGPISAHLAVGTSGPSMHVFARLLDVSPTGEAHMIVRGQAIVHAPHPDRLTTVDLSHTGYRVRAGHQLRLHVASSDFPLYLPYPGTDENPWMAIRGKRNTQTLTAGGEAGSYVSLTVR